MNINFRKALTVLAVAASAAGLSAPAYAGGSYLFTVACQNGSGIAQWNTGGHEYLRVATGTNNPGCSVSDYNPSRDSGLPVTVYSGAPAVVQGIPFVGEIIENILGW
jgi:hypothetical protein